MLNNDDIKNNLKTYLTKNGIKQRFIARKLNLSDTTISLFIKGKIELSQNKLNLINNIVHFN